MRPERTLIFWLVCLIGLVAFSPYGWGHDGYSKWMKPDNPKSSCCNHYDCRPAQARYDEERKRYFALVEGVWVEIPPEKILDPKLKDNENPDGSYHVCYSQDGRREIFCFREAEPKI